MRVVVALGAIAWRAYLERIKIQLPTPRPAFAHGARLQLDPSASGTALPVVLASYHVSQQNTQTGRLTPTMFDRVLADATQCAKARSAPRGG